MVQTFYRASNPSQYVMPPSIRYAHRYGPPKALIDGQTLPFGWLYAAEDARTAASEALFFQNDARRPGTYYADRDACRNGVIARLDFDTPLPVWDMCGDAANRLGVYDSLVSPDHEWCTWFGYLVHFAMMALAPEDRPMGFRYPSRRHPTFAALAMHSSHLDAIRQRANITEVRFEDYLATPEFACDALLVQPPEATC